MTRTTRLITLTLMALALTVTLLAPGQANASPASTPKAVTHAADRLHCTNRVQGSETASGFTNKGISCTAHRPDGGRAYFAVLRYDDPKAGIWFWRFLISGPGWFAKRGHVLLIPLGGPGDVPAYSKRWARWASVRVEGRLLGAES